MKIRRCIVIESDPRSVFELVDDPSRYGEFFVGITQWQSRSRKKRGVGARYRVLMRVGSIDAGGIVAVTERRPDELISWRSEQGIRQEGCWMLRSVAGGTELCLDVAFDLSGGPLGALVERLTGRIVGRNLWATLLAARRLLELETRAGAVRGGKQRSTR